MEREQTAGPYHFFNIPMLKSRQQVLNELVEPCGRFAFDIRSIQSDFKVARLAARFDPFSENGFLLATNTPANWQALLRFLHEHGVTSSRTASSLPARYDMPKIYTASLDAGPHAPDNDGIPVNSNGFGASYTDATEALSKAFGELLERHFSSTYKKSDLMFASFDELNRRRFGHRPLDIFLLNDFLPSQKDALSSFVRDRNRRLGWVQGREEGVDTPVYLPAQLVYWNYSYGTEGYLQECNTSGVAGHFTREEALLGALLELIQRDGFIVHWLRVKQPRRIDQSTITDPDVISLLEKFKRSGVEVHLLDVTTDISVPTCLAVLLDARGGRHEVHMASGTGFTQRETMRSALVELTVVYSAQLDSQPPLPLEEPYEPFKRPINNLERLRVWRTKKMYDIFLPFVQGPLETVEEFMRGMEQYETVESRLGYVRQCLSNLGEGYEIYTYEYQNPLLRRIGFHVIRAIVPRIVGLYLFENSGSLAAERLSSVPPKLGLETREGLNPWPHPFP